jgi:hypothetical protein
MQINCGSTSRKANALKKNIAAALIIQLTEA